MVGKSDHDRILGRMPELGFSQDGGSMRSTYGLLAYASDALQHEKGESALELMSFLPSLLLQVTGEMFTGGREHATG